MTGLSEKAKGKQRAIDITPIEGNRQPPAATQRPLTIRFTDGLPDLVLTLDAKDAVRDIKQKIRKTRPQLAKRRLRLIYSGRILADSLMLFQWLEDLEKRQKRTSDSKDEKGKGKERDDSEVGCGSADSPSRLWLHCSVGAEMAEDEEDDEERIQKSQIKPLRGFDRLTTAGFSEEEIANFRRTFHSQSAANFLDVEPIGEDEDYEEHARALEEQWIDSIDGGTNSPLSPSSASTTLLQGLLVGFFFPLLPFFFFHESRPAIFWENGRGQAAPNSVVFSKRMQMAIVLGFILNIMFGMWRYLLSG